MIFTYTIHTHSKQEGDNEPLNYQAVRNAVHMKTLYRSMMVSVLGKSQKKKGGKLTNGLSPVCALI